MKSFRVRGRQLHGLRPVRAGALQDAGVVRQGLRHGRDPRGAQEGLAVQPVQLTTANTKTFHRLNSTVFASYFGFPSLNKLSVYQYIYPGAEVPRVVLNMHDFTKNLLEHSLEKHAVVYSSWHYYLRRGRHVIDW